MITYVERQRVKEDNAQQVLSVEKNGLVQTLDYQTLIIFYMHVSQYSRVSLVKVGLMSCMR